MSSATRRPSLPGADELFRSTGPATSAPSVAQSTAAELLERSATTPVAEPVPVAATAPTRTPARPAARPTGDRSPSGREKHDKKITVYLSPEELVDIERARLTLAAEHGLYVDRGRIVREAVAVVIADLEDKSGASILVRRLHGG